MQVWTVNFEQVLAYYATHFCIKHLPRHIQQVNSAKETLQNYMNYVQSWKSDLIWIDFIHFFTVSIANFEYVIVSWLL